MSPSNTTYKTAKEAKAFTDTEREILKETARERKAAARRKPGNEREDGLRDIQAKIAEMPESDRRMAERFHEIVTSNAPSLMPRTWYGMPAYAKDGKIVCFFQAADKFKARYATFGFDQAANLDEGSMWPTSWAATKLTKADEERIAALVRKAVS